ncbi:ATP-dependent helicase [Homoserinimonas sp. OAct 916]|uniref:ATP-dependent helicase n=1 Tax=Homoserinimonas sp. OAct 916 TaxID=2211450 RepID=UPI000DBE2A4F|nr:ATP-dependent helicase [Homoserinimonas sp. OAct 916]
MTNDSPESLLAGLDDQQRVAAEAVLGPVCILAGAGTGKTRAITHRIAYGVASGVYAPSRVMALTFTAKAATELRSRLRMLGAPNVAARTFHAAALSQLSYFWPQVVGGNMPKIVESKGRLLGHAAEMIRVPVTTGSLREFAAEVEWRKVSRLGIEQYAKALESRPVPGNLSVDQAVALQQAYEDIKDERRLIDFEDILLATAGMIEAEPRVALQVREQYRFFVVDEYQDVSPLQYELLQAWLGDRRDLCVVGDASQTVYSFAGATATYLLEFEQKYTDAQVVRLEQNYRSTTEIIQTANALMRGRAGSLELRPAAARVTEPSAAVVRAAYPSDVLEARAVAQAIKATIDSGVQPKQIAVLYRINVQSAVLETALADLGVPVQLSGSTRFFDHPEVRQAVMALRAASVSIVGEPLFKSVSDVLRSLGWSQHPPETAGAVRDRWELLNALMGLVDLVPAGTTFRDFTDDLLQRQAAHHAPDLSAVTLATLHSAKGMEWDTVFLVGLSEGLLPISYATTRPQQDEERRLLYVGITRAKRALQLSYAESSAGRREVRRPSRFLAELDIRTPDGRRPDAS